MPFIELSLDSLKDLDDGRAMLMFTHELKRAVLDCMDRPGDKNARTVTLKMAITPIVADDGSCEGASAEFQCHASIPKRKTKTYEFRVNKNGQLAYSLNNPTDKDQAHIDDLDHATGRVIR